MKITLLLAFAGLVFNASGQSSLPSSIADSLWGVWTDETQPDSNRLKSIHTYAWDGHLFTQPDSAFYYARLQYDFAKQKGNKKHQADALNTQGTALYFQGDYKKAIDVYTRSLKIRELIGDKKGIASTLGNIGNIYKEQDDHFKALEYYTRCLKIMEETGSVPGVASCLNNMGLIYSRQNDLPKAIDHYTRSLKFREETGDKKGIAASLNNIGNIYLDLAEYEKALNYHNRSLKIREEMEDKQGLAMSLTSIGNIHKKQGQYGKAIPYIIKGLALAKGAGVVIETRDAAYVLYEAYKNIGRHKDALEMHELYMQMKDSIQSEESQQEIVRQEYKYEYEKKEAIAKAEESKKEALHKEALEQQTMQRDGFIGGFALMLLLAGVSYRNYRNKRKAHEIITAQKSEVEHQKSLVEEKNRDITDSINYAKRLQHAILPSGKLIKENLKDSFILYKPKDIVAGDFYWMEKKDDLVFIAAADCTGHGVPGAMISVVCSNALNRTVKEFGLTEPGEILDKVRELVIETFEKSESEVKDGMDISLCAINNLTQQVSWAGANNPLWFLSGNELKELKPDKQPIGKYDVSKSFTTHKLLLNKREIIYLFTDGYADQFGGEKGKKFKYSKLKELLLSIANKPMHEQKEILNETFEAWKGNLEQVDDVCIIGVKI